jgi:hypothetical protein
MKYNHENISIEAKELARKKSKIKDSTVEFFAQYKDPRWQKKRLKIMERDEFSCVSCNTKDVTLNVHHRVPYRKDTKPWEYEDDELITLCEDCHKEISEIIDYCKLVIMGRCWCVDSANEMTIIMGEIDGMNPYQLEAVWQIIRAAKKF